MRACTWVIVATCGLAACDEQTYGPSGKGDPAPLPADLAQAPVPLFEEGFDGATVAGDAISAQHSWTIDGDCQNLRWAPVASCGASGCVRVEGNTDAGCRLSTTLRLPQVPAGDRLVLTLRHQYRFAAGSSGTLRVSLPGDQGPVHALTRRFSVGRWAEGDWRPYAADLSDLPEGDYQVSFTLNSSAAAFAWSLDGLLLQREPQ